MDMMKRLLDELPKVWNKEPKSIAYISVVPDILSKHNYITVRDGYLYLHPFLFDENRKGEMDIFDLTQYTLQTLVDELNTKQLTVSFLQPSPPLKDKLAVILDIGTNISINSNLYVATNNNWLVIYPISVFLSRAKDDVGTALKQLYLSSASGAWLDYWASFMGTKRRTGESDADFVRRIILNLFNPKVNNIAMEEHLSFLTGTSVRVEDISPMTISVSFSSQVSINQADLNALIEEIKPVGVAYFVGSYLSYTEYFKTYYQDRHGKSFSRGDSFSAQVARSESFNMATRIVESVVMTAQRDFTDIMRDATEALSSILERTLSEPKFKAPTDGMTSTLERTISETKFGMRLNEASQTQEYYLTDVISSILERALSEAKFRTPTDTISSTLQRSVSESYTKPTESISMQRYVRGWDESFVLGNSGAGLRNMALGATTTSYTVQL